MHTTKRSIEVDVAKCHTFSNASQRQSKLSQKCFGKFLDCKRDERQFRHTHLKRQHLVPTGIQTWKQFHMYVSVNTFSNSKCCATKLLHLHVQGLPLFLIDLVRDTWLSCSTPSIATSASTWRSRSLLSCVTGSWWPQITYIVQRIITIPPSYWVDCTSSMLLECEGYYATVRLPWRWPSLPLRHRMVLVGRNYDLLFAMQIQYWNFTYFGWQGLQNSKYPTFQVMPGK